MLDERVARLAAPAILIRHSDAPSRSHLGGWPSLPTDQSWPTAPDRRPLSFLARIQLDEAQAALSVSWLPADGELLFFYDMQTMPWGFDPKDRGFWRVLYAPSGSLHEASQERAVSGTSPADLQALRRQGIAFYPINSLPAPESEQVHALKLPSAAIETLIESIHSLSGEEPHHQISGHASPVQNDNMALECQLASHGVYCGDANGYRSSESRELALGASQWRLLFQFDSDSALDVMWGDCGMLYFWVKEESARYGDFSDTWLVLQCC
jgi:uncharacterized protein YwqG